MRTKAVRLYGANDLRLDEFELPEMRDDEILAHLVSDSVCMSTYKAAKQGSAHKRVPADIARNPVMVGHEFCGEIVAIGKKWKDSFREGDRFTVQTALNLKDDPYAAPGYSFRYIGGSATHVIIPNVVMESGCLLPYGGEAFFYGSLAEPMSCIIGAFQANYHMKDGCHEHTMGILDGGNMAILAGAGPMGLGAVDYAIHSEKKPRLLVVTDIDESRLVRAASIHTVREAEKNGIKLVYVNTLKMESPEKELLSFSEGKGYDDVFVFAPVRPVVEFGDRILGHDGCLNFFAGPTDPGFSAGFNFYNVHYNSTHLAGTSGGNTQDMEEALEIMASARINPSSMITHVGGLNSAVETILNLPNIPGGKKLIYTNIEMELCAIADFAKKGGQDSLFADLAGIVERNNGLWSAEAENYLLAHAKAI